MNISYFLRKYLEFEINGLLFYQLSGNPDHGIEFGLYTIGDQYF